MTPTTRTYPRSTLEAFGCDATSARAIERPIDHADRIVLIGCVGAVVVVLMLVVAGVLA